MRCVSYLIRSYSSQRTTLSCRPGDPYFAYINFGHFPSRQPSGTDGDWPCFSSDAGVVYSWFCTRPVSMIAPCRLAPAPESLNKSSASARIHSSVSKADDLFDQFLRRTLRGTTHRRATDTHDVDNTRLPVEESRATSRSSCRTRD